MRLKNFIKLLLLVILFIGIFISLSYIFGPSKKKPPQDKAFRGVAWFRFDKKDSLEGWEEKVFKGRVIYSVKLDRSGGYLDALSNNSASGIVHWLKFNPRQNPMVSWKWKVMKFPETRSGAQEEGTWLEKDDYAARFYIIFPRFPLTRFQCLEYVWDKSIPAGTVLANPVFPNLKIIVAESGTANLGKWVTEERNIYEDFKRIFGSNPGDVGAIAIMTDSENTASTAQAAYNDIEVGYAK